MHRKIYHIIKKNLVYLQLFLKLLYKNFTFKPKSDNFKIYIDIKEDIGRYYYLLIKFFSYSNVEITINCNLRLFYNNLKYNEYIFNIVNLRFKNKVKSPNEYVYIYDQVPQLKEWKHSVKIFYDVFSSDRVKNKSIIPYSMHPMIYEMQLEKKLSINSFPKKNISVFFAGGGVGIEYDNKIIKEEFNKISRKKVLELLKKRFQEEVIIINNENQLNEKSFLGNIVLIDGNTYRIPVEQWLETLKKTWFFLALPGVFMPLSHNIIEAMSVGVIPITQYPELFTPPLIDNYNCLYYGNEQELISKTAYALELSEEKMSKMSKNVLRYYKQHLDYQNVSQNILFRLEKIEELYYNTEEISLSKSILKK